MNPWLIATVVLLAVFVGIAIPVLLQLRRTLAAAEVVLEKTGKRVDEALDEFSETAKRINNLAKELEEGAARVRVLFDVAGDVGKTAAKLRDSIHTATSAANAVGPALVAGIRALWSAKKGHDGEDADAVVSRAHAGQDPDLFTREE